MFQKRIVEKYSAKLNKTIIDEKYDLFRSIFANPEKQENIRNSKEEQYQEGFLRDLFVSVLGYTINPEPNYNLLTEQKNISKGNDNRKADGAVIFDNKVKVVIELKGTDTTDLNKIESQAFLYKEHNPECKYVVISNFERLRFYVENAIEFIEFNLFNLSRNDFQMLYLCLEINQIKNDIPLQLKHETVSQEKEITDSFYGDYSVFKRNLFEDIYTNNPDFDKLLLFKKTQKLLDRILFILFCEDRGLLPENSISKIIAQWEQLKDLDAYQPLYTRFQNFFNRINEGYTSPKNPSENIFAYNGGLFKPDEILDNIKIGDDVLYLYSKRLSDYDFDSQISVDILGHIFEHSLTEIEEVQKQIEAEKSGLTTEKTDIGKRKKDGVFYTPSYITKYIVENTIGKLCNEKKEELGIKDSAFSKTKKTSKDKDELNKKLEDYKQWLLSLKILDPACGSGAFLNAALKQLKIEHTLIDYYRAKIYGDSMIFQDVENDILEKNIFGVDINEESVEIAKLSLWLHTAQK
nr:N-6 DNA methylase [Treponema sp.]